MACCVWGASPFKAWAEPADDNALRWYASVSGVSVLPSTSDTTVGDYDLDSALGVVGAVGVQSSLSTIPSLSLYGEVEVGTRTLEEENSRAEVQTTTILANVGVKKAVSSSVSLYSALGVGMGMHEVTSLEPTWDGFDDTTVALQYVAGLEYAITHSFAGKVGYRLLGTTAAKGSGFEATYRTHGFEFGVLYYF